MKAFSIESKPNGDLRLRLFEDGEEMGGGGAPDTPEDRAFLEDQAYAWGAAEEVQPDGAHHHPG